MTPAWGHCWRANRLAKKLDNIRRGFQSAPVIAGGLLRSVRRTSCRCVLSSSNKMNDLLVGDGYLNPLVARARVEAMANKLVRVSLGKRSSNQRVAHSERRVARKVAVG